MTWRRRETVATASWWWGDPELATTSLDELLATARDADGPSFPPPGKIKTGGVDPLGLRQINFDLMDKLLPGLNNVARHVRPFVVVAWASRRAIQLANDSGLTEAKVDQLRDFVDRIEVIYAWSQFLRSPDTDLPGRDVLSRLVAADKYVFGGDEWRKRRTAREFSTALTAPVNYGPALKVLGWVEGHTKFRRLLIPRPESYEALDAFENVIEDRLDHPAFSQLGEVEVTSAEARGWAEAWSNETVTPAEQRTLAEMLFGERAPRVRREGVALMIAAVQHGLSNDTGAVRAAMAGRPSNFVISEDLNAASDAWRRVQVRQAFRLAMESMFSWIVGALDGGPKSTDRLVARFLTEMSETPRPANSGNWLNQNKPERPAPTEVLERLQSALQDKSGDDLASSIVEALALCLAEDSAEGDSAERADRLPLWRARQEAEAWRDRPVEQFLGHIIETWVLAQHVYWSVGRGLADARARGKTILRLRVVLDEGGWTLAPGATRTFPIPTPDRLQTALSLAKECGLLTFTPAAA
jgi:hypothetical protein